MIRFFIIKPQKKEDERKRVLTRNEIRRDEVEHVGVHVSVYDPIARCVVTSSNEDGISLSHGDTYQVYRR